MDADYGRRKARTQTIEFEILKMQKRVLALGRMKAGVMNRTEKEFAEYLQRELDNHKIISFAFEPITLKLAKDLRFTPDFMVHEIDGYITFFEVKGFWRDDALAKIKMASEKFPMFRFVSVKRSAVFDFSLC